MRSSGLRAFSLGAVVLVALAGCGDAAARQEGRGAIRRGGDVLAAGDRVRFTDTIPGDAILAAGEIAFSGRTGGDYLGAGGEQRITGRVLGDVRAAGGEIRLEAEVARNATIAGGSVDVRGNATVRRNAYLAGGTVRVAGTVEGFLRVMGSEVILDGAVGEDVEVEAGRLVVGPNARIGGSLRYRVPESRVRIDPAAQIAGQRIALPPRQRPDIDVGMRFFRILRLLAFFATGLVAVAAFPRLADAAAASLRQRPWASLGLGFVWVVVVPVAIALVAITVVGIPIAMIVGALYLISLYLARAVFAVWLGRLLLRDRLGPGRKGAVLAFLVGGAILVVAGMIPYLGWLVGAIATLLGLGASALAIWSRRATPRHLTTEH